MSFKAILIIYVVLVSIIGFLIMGYDKSQAQQNGWRVSEFTLFLIAIIGGSFGIFLGMRVYRHKTQKFKFNLGISVIMVSQVFLIIKISSFLNSIF